MVMKDKIAEILREYRTKVIVEEETKVRVYDLELNIADQILALFKEAELKWYNTGWEDAMKERVKK
jgi:hypothetical protein